MLKLEQPQEIEVWYVIPAIRKELVSHFLQDFGLNQKQAAHLLGISEAAVSNYIKSKRANEITFDSHFKSLIKAAAMRIKDNKNLLTQEIQIICSLFKEKELLCDLHHKVGTVYDEDCKVCLKDVSSQTIQTH